MRAWRLLVTAALAALPSSPAFPADLSPADQPLVKEPRYHSRPKYCLLAFGPEAKARAWLVQDDNTLYVDRNGNGDLTEEGEQVLAEKPGGGDEAAYLFTAGAVQVGGRVHKELQVSVGGLDHLADYSQLVKALLARDPKARGYQVSLDVEIPGEKGTGLGGRVRQYVSPLDVNGILQFAGRPQDAPVLHFDGPRQITLFSRQHLTVGRSTDLILAVGTPGRGPGTTAYFGYDELIPKEVYPTVEVTYPPKAPGEQPVRERYELKQRC